MAGITYDGIPSTEVDSINFSGTNFYGSVGSIVTLRNTNYLGVGSVSDGQGRLRSTFLGSGTVGAFGGWIQVGSAVTSAGSVGFANFGQATSDTNYYLMLTGRRYADGTGSVAAWESGTRSTSGVSFVGAASANYNFVVIGT